MQKEKLPPPQPEGNAESPKTLRKEQRGFPHPWGSPWGQGAPGKAHTKMCMYIYIIYIFIYKMGHGGVGKSRRNCYLQPHVSTTMSSYCLYTTLFPESM